MSFSGVLQTIGRDFAKGLKFAVQYAVPVEKLAALLFPTAGPALNTLVDATTLIQNAVLLVEQKYAASGVQAGTGPQKLAEVLLLAGNAVASLLSKAGVNATVDYVERLVSAVVAILNAQAMTGSANTAPTAAR